MLLSRLLLLLLFGINYVDLVICSTFSQHPTCTYFSMGLRLYALWEGGRGVGADIKRMGVLVRNFEKNHSQVQDPVLWSWLDFFFFSKGYQF